MENVYTNLSGLHELYMLRYVKMLPVYRASCAFFPPALFLPQSPLLSTTPFKSPKFAFLSDDKRLLDVN